MPFSFTSLAVASFHVVVCFPTKRFQKYISANIWKTSTCSAHQSRNQRKSDCLCTARATFVDYVCPPSKGWLQSSFCGYLKACHCLLRACHNTAPDVLKPLVPLSLTAMAPFNPSQLTQIILGWSNSYCMLKSLKKNKQQLTSDDWQLILMQNKLFS